MLRGEAAPGLVLMMVAAAALALANSPMAPAYHDVFHHRLGWSPVPRLGSLHAWINDALMAVFFFVVGLEIKREAISGALSRPESRRLPVIAAIAGMAAPAAVYLAVVGPGSPLARGWAIPAATDIAFAMGVIALLGPRVPRSLRLFLLTVAIVDDIGAVAIIALAYTGALDGGWLAAALLVVAGLIALNRGGVVRTGPYVGLAVVLWYAVLHAGVHPTVAGVAAAFTVPDRRSPGGPSPLRRLEHGLVPWNAFGVVPLFGFANAGVALGGAGGGPTSLALAVGLGLVLGKQAGIFASLALAHRLGFAEKPRGTSWGQVWGVALLCGIGFTMSLFIAALAFPADPELVEQAKLGVLGGSLVSALAGFAVLRRTGPARP